VLLLANENQNARRQCENSHYDCRDGDVKEQSDSCENQIDSEQEHSEVFGDVHDFLSEAKRLALHALNCAEQHPPAFTDSSRPSAMPPCSFLAVRSLSAGQR
jgi:hypothetical protein